MKKQLLLMALLLIPCSGFAAEEVINAVAVSSASKINLAGDIYSARFTGFVSYAKPLIEGV